MCDDVMCDVWFECWVCEFVLMWERCDDVCEMWMNEWMIVFECLNLKCYGVCVDDVFVFDFE